MEDEHGGQNSTNLQLDRPQSDQEERKLATTPKQMAASLDDRNFLLHPGRFLMGPLNWQHSMKNCPVEQSPVFTQLDLSHIGLHPFNRKTVKGLHNRANRNFRLHHFSNKNLRKLQEEKRYDLAGGQMVEGKGYSEIKTESEAVLAFHNYEQLMRFIHSMDFGPQALYRTVLEHSLAGTVPSVVFLATFFEEVVGQNAYRADNRQASLSYEECSQKWDILLRTTGRTPSFSSGEVAGPAMGTAVASALQELTRALGDFKNERKDNNTLTVAPSANSKRKKNVYCPLYNTVSGCTNPKRPGGCRSAAGVDQKHGCNIRMKPNNRACNSTQHNAINHK